MFETPSQQILAILEALRQSSKTLGKMEPPASDNDWEMLDVYTELFHAANSIITGKCISINHWDIPTDKSNISRFFISQISINHGLDLFPY